MVLQAKAALFFSVAVFLTFLAWVPPAEASSDPDVKKVGAVNGTGGDDIANTDLSNWTGVHVASYYCASGTPSPCAPDGGEGLFIKGTGTCTPDGGSVVLDGAPTPNCWYRQNLNGDLRQWGITYKSIYDVAFFPTGATPAGTKIMTQVIPALTAAGIHTIHTGQVSILLETNLVLPAGWSFTCDVPPAKPVTNADYTALPGSLVLELNITLDAHTNTNVEIHDCAAIVPQWYVNHTVSFTGSKVIAHSPASYSYADLEAIRANMAAAGNLPAVGGLGIWAGDGAFLHDLTILGFDNCINLDHSNKNLLKNITMDCDIGVYETAGNGQSAISDLNVEPLLTKSTSNPNEQYWTVNKVQMDSATGECQLDLVAASGQPSISQITDSATDDAFAPSGQHRRGDPYYYPAWVTGLGNMGMSCESSGTGRFGNDAAWAIKKVSGGGLGHQLVDLKGSKYSTSSSAATPISVDTLGDWLANTGVLRISGSMSNIVSGMEVTQSGGAGWPSVPVTVASVIQRCTGPDPNDGYNGCVVVSPVPTQASGTAVLHFFSMADGALTGATCDGSSGKPCLFNNAAERYVDGNSAAGLATTRLPAARGGHLAPAYFLDNIAGLRAINTNAYGHYYNIAAIDSGNCNFFQLTGDDNGELNAANSAGLYVTGSARGCLFVGKGPGKPGTAIVSDTFAATAVSTLGTFVVNAMTDDPTTVTTLSPIDTTGSFPTFGEIQICKNSGCGGADVEFVSYKVHTVGTSGSIDITVRSRFGTPPINWQVECPSGCTATVNTVQVSGGSTKHPDKSASVVFSSLDNNTTTSSLNQFEVHHGSATLDKLHTGGGGIGFVSTNTSGVSVNSVALPKATLYFEDENARALTTVSPDSLLQNSPQQGALNLPLSYYQWFGPPQAMSAEDSSGYPIAITSDYLGIVDIQDTSNWPQSGILLVDSEYVAFHTQGRSKLVFDKRAVCGSSAAGHLLNSIGSYLNIMFGCPTGTGAPQLSMDSTGQITGQQLGLAHGQVYMSFDGSNVQLCQHNGSGLLLAGVLRQVRGCALLPQTGAAAGFQYVYATYHQTAITKIENQSGHPRLHVTSTDKYVSNSALTCYGITGNSAVLNGITFTNTTLGTGIIDLPAQPPITSPGSETGACEYVGLEFSNTAYALSGQGVQTMSGDGSKTLVGAVYADSIGAIADDSAHRDVASWFNANTKTCSEQILTVDITGTHVSSYTELTAALRCEFIILGPNKAVWSIAGSALDTTGSSIVSTAAGFDGATPAMEYTEASNVTRFPISVSGAADLNEGIHYITLLYKTSTGSATYKVGSSIQARLAQ